MRETPTVSDLAPLHIDRRQVLRNLGYPRSRQPSARVAEALDRLWEPALALLAPRGVHRMVREAVAQATGMPRPTEWVGLGACTAGPELERREQQLGQQGQMLEALILDAIGSTAAEAAADAVNVMLCAEARREGYHLPPRISPGYGRWPIERQPDLLGLLAADAIGIHLTPGLMMVPRKSVSFGVRLTRQPQPRVRRRCAGCTLEGCAFRDQPPEGHEEP